MKVFTFDFDLDAWIQDIEIEAEDLEEAKEQLFNMSLSELIENGYVKDFDIRNLDYDVEEYYYDAEE